MELAEQLAGQAEVAGALGIYYDEERMQYVVVMPQSRADAFEAAYLGLSVRVETRAIEQEDIDAIIAALESRSFSVSAATLTYGFYFDPETGQVVIDTPDPSPFGSLAAAADGKIRLQVGSGGRQSRDNDSSPFAGGAEIHSALGGCTSGYTVRNGAGTKYMVTAAHCAALNAAITGGTGLAWGTVKFRGPFPAWDVELIGGKAYEGYIWVGTATGTRHGVTSAHDPVVGPTSYCVSGATTNEHCGHHCVSLSGQLCDESGCTNGLAVYQDGTLTQGGDSGAPWYYYDPQGKIIIAGSHVGRIGGNMYAERWLATSSHFSVSIVTQ